MYWNYLSKTDFIPIQLIGIKNKSLLYQSSFIYNFPYKVFSDTAEYLWGKFFSCPRTIANPPPKIIPSSKEIYLLHEENNTVLEIEECSNQSWFADNCIFLSLPEYGIKPIHIDEDIINLLSALSYTFKYSIEKQNIDLMMDCTAKQDLLLYSGESTKFLELYIKDVPFKACKIAKNIFIVSSYYIDNIKENMSGCFLRKFLE